MIKGDTMWVFISYFNRQTFNRVHLSLKFTIYWHPTIN